MLIGQDQPAAEQAAAVVDEAVVDGGEHVDVQIGKLQLKKAHASLVGFVEIDALSLWDCVSSCAFAFLFFFISQMVCRADFCHIIHIFCPALHFKERAGAVIIKCDM